MHAFRYVLVAGWCGKQLDVRCSLSLSRARALSLSLSLSLPESFSLLLSLRPPSSLTPIAGQLGPAAGEFSACWSPCGRFSCRCRGAETRGRGVCTLEFTQAAGRPTASRARRARAAPRASTRPRAAQARQTPSVPASPRANPAVNTSLARRRRKKAAAPPAQTSSARLGSTARANAAAPPTASPAVRTWNAPRVPT